MDLWRSLARIVYYYYYYYYYYRESEQLTLPKVPSPCPLFVFVNVGWKPAKPLGSGLLVEQSRDG